MSANIHRSSQYSEHVYTSSHIPNGRENDVQHVASPWSHTRAETRHDSILNKVRACKFIVSSLYVYTSCDVWLCLCLSVCFGVYVYVCVRARVCVFMCVCVV